MCYIEVSEVSYDAANNEVRILGEDLDNVILRSWEDAYSPKAIEACFNLENRGPRIYLFKILRNVVKEDCTSLADMVSKLPGKIINISESFVVKAEG